MAPVCRFSHGSQQLHYTNPPSSLSTLKTEIKKERLKLGLCASLLVPSSIDGWVHSEGESLLRGERKETRKKQASSKWCHWGERGTLRRRMRRPCWPTQNLGQIAAKQSWAFGRVTEKRKVRWPWRPGSKFGPNHAQALFHADPA